MSITIRVTILGREYPLRVDPAHEAFTRRVAALVDERIRAVERQAPGHPDLTHAVIAAMSLAEELLRLREGRPEPQPAAPAPEREHAAVYRAQLRALAREAAALADRLDAALAASEDTSPKADGTNPGGGSDVSPPASVGGGA